MPYKPIDTKEDVTAAPGGINSQPVVPQTGTTTGSIGASGGGTGATGPKLDNSYTNLSSYLQANAGNNTNANAVDTKVFQPLTKQTSANAGEWMQNGADIKNATQGVRDSQPGATNALLQQTYGNTWGGASGGGKAALDSALGYRGIIDKGQAAQDARASQTWQDPKGFASGTTPEAYAPPQHTVPEAQNVSPTAPVSNAPDPGGHPWSPGIVNTAPAASAPQAKASTPGSDLNKLNKLHPSDANPYDSVYKPPGGTSSTFPGLFAHGGEIPQPYNELMEKMRIK